MNNDLFKAGISRRCFLTGAGALGVLAGLGLTGCGAPILRAAAPRVTRARPMVS